MNSARGGISKDTEISIYISEEHKTMENNSDSESLYRIYGDGQVHSCP